MSTWSEWVVGEMIFQEWPTAAFFNSRNDGNFETSSVCAQQSKINLNTSMPLPIPRKSTALHFYKYRSPAQLGWLRDTLLEHEIYMPNLTELNDDNDGLPRLAMQTEEEMANFLWDRFKRENPNMPPEQAKAEEAILRFNVRLHGPAALHPNLVQLLDAQLKDFRVYSMTKRYDMGNLWALYADGHRGCCLEFENVGPLFEHAKDVTYLDFQGHGCRIIQPYDGEGIVGQVLALERGIDVPAQAIRDCEPGRDFPGVLAIKGEVL